MLHEDDEPGRSALPPGLQDRAVYDDPWLLRVLGCVGSWLKRMPLLTLSLWLADLGILIIEALRGGVRGVLGHLALHLLRHREVRSLVRFFVGLFLLIPSTLMVIFPLFDQPVLAAELTTVTGQFVRHGFEPDGDLELYLANHNLPFVIAANAREIFDAQQFVHTIQPGDTVQVDVRQRQINDPQATSLVVFAVQRGTTVELSVDQINVVAQQTSRTHMFLGLAGLVIGGLAVWNWELSLLIVGMMLGILALIWVLQWLGW